MQKFRNILACVLVAVMVIPALGDGVYDKSGSSYWGAKDETPCVRLKSLINDSTTIRIASNGYGNATFTSAGIVNNINLGTAVTNVDDFVGYIVALTNASGRQLFEADGDCALAADQVFGKLLSTSYTVQAGKWGTIYFQGLSNKTYGVSIPSRDNGGPANDKVLRKLNGSLGGTGVVTVAVYVEREVKWQKTVQSPAYTSIGLVSSNATANLVNIDYDVEIPIGRASDVFIRATRGTDANAPGGIGATVEFK